MQASGRSGKDRTFLRAGFVADRNDVSEELSGFEDIEDSLRFVFRNIDPNFCHHLHGERIKRARFKTGALCFEKLAAGVIQPGLGHLAAGAVVDANEENAFFHLRKERSSGVGWAKAEATDVTQLSH
jgi:hypothetical protein